eukprot:scaffold28770_cov64-Phaeocystis_antarctica.AAC.10
MCMYLRGARCRSAARAQVVLPPERLPAASLLYFLPLRLQPQAPTRTPTLARTPTTALTPTLTLTLTLTRRLGGSHTWNAPVIVRRADVPSGFDFVKFPFAKKRDWASSAGADRGFHLARTEAFIWRGQRLSAGADRGFHPVRTEARSRLRLPPAPAHLGLSAAWAALTGPIGRVLDTGSGQHLNRFGPPALQLYKHLSNGEGGSVPGGGVPLLRDPEGYGRPIVERGARLCCENDPPMPPAVPQAATLPHVVLQNPDAFRSTAEPCSTLAAARDTATVCPADLLTLTH